MFTFRFFFHFFPVHFLSVEVFKSNEFFMAGRLSYVFWVLNSAHLSPAGDAQTHFEINDFKILSIERRRVTICIWKPGAKCGFWLVNDISSQGANGIMKSP